jgi:hypothetical protein
MFFGVFTVFLFSEVSFRLLFGLSKFLFYEIEFELVRSHFVLCLSVFSGENLKLYIS